VYPILAKPRPFAKQKNVPHTGPANKGCYKFITVPTVTSLPVVKVIRADGGGLGLLSDHLPVFFAIVQQGIRYDVENHLDSASLNLCSIC
jgi:hypothetical protein